MSNSWLHLRGQSVEYRLSEDLARQDPFGARDCGWVEQMRPFIRQFAPPGACILDPFCGFGSTLVAAQLEGRRAIGIDIDATRVHLTQQRLASLGMHHASVQCGDAQVLCAQIEAVDLIISNLPYFGCQWVAGAQGDGDGQLNAGQLYAGQLYSTASYAQYLDKIRQCLIAFKRVLKPDAYLVLMLQNIRIGAHFVPQAWDVGNLLRERFHFVDERILIYDKPVPEPERILSNRAHEYALIAQNCAKPIDLALTHRCLLQLHALHPELIVYGSFAQWLDGAALCPSDLDIFLPWDMGLINALAQWLEEQHFQLTRWGGVLETTQVSLAMLGANYFRATRLDAQGRLVLLDISFSPDPDVYARLAQRSRVRQGLRCVAGLD